MTVSVCICCCFWWWCRRWLDSKGGGGGSSSDSDNTFGVNWDIVNGMAKKCSRIFLAPLAC